MFSVKTKNKHVLCPKSGFDTTSTGGLISGMLGPSKYDLECEHVRKMTGASGGVILLVFGGNKGMGISCQVIPEIDERLPAILRRLADLIEREHKEQTELAKGN